MDLVARYIGASEAGLRDLPSLRSYSRAQLEIVIIIVIGRDIQEGS
jgi:hypothetical protein